MKMSHIYMYYICALCIEFREEKEFLESIYKVFQKTASLFCIYFRLALIVVSSFVLNRLNK